MPRTRAFVVVVIALTLALGTTGTTRAQTAASPPDVAPSLSDQLRGSLTEGLDRGLDYLAANQQSDGSFENSVGVSGLVASAFLREPASRRQGFEETIDRALEYIADKAKDDGGIYLRDLPNYHTAVALTALVESGREEYSGLIAKARDFLVGLQAQEGNGYTTEDKFYGGIGYGSDLRPDLANMEYALAALKTSGLPNDDPLWDRALTFVRRAQNYSETNDQAWAGNDGGFVYYPGFSYGGDGQGTQSYGSMTYAGLMSYSYAEVESDDPQVEAALEWIGANFDVDENPGMGAKALYYYYLIFAKALQAQGEAIIVDTDGVPHNWREELGAKLLDLQYPEGYWVNVEAPDWMQDNKVLVTAFTVQAIQHILAD